MLITSDSLRVKEWEINYDMERIPNLVKLNLVIVLDFLYSHSLCQITDCSLLFSMVTLLGINLIMQT